MKLSPEQHILVAPTAFKDSLTARGAAEFIQAYLFNRGFRNLTMFPASDGGNGFLDTLSLCQPGHFITVQIPRLGTRFYNPEKVWISQDGKSAALESAILIGLEQIPAAQRNPMMYNSRPLGVAIQALMKLYPALTEIYVGVGGTATIDGGIGILEGLGFRFLSATGAPLTANPSDWPDIRRIEKPTAKFPLIHFIYDAVIPQEGSDSFINLYGDQKGLKATDVATLKSVFSTWRTQWNIPRELSGAGGGLMLLPSVFLPCKFEHGTVWFSKTPRFAEAIAHADVVLTGEGKIDFQTFQGKWLTNFLDFRKQVVVLAGQVDGGLKFPPNWTVLALTDLEPDVAKSIKLTKVLLRSYLEQLVG
ncbi:MAG: glycerate kinase [Bacteroidetes bacterium]|nr:glycerate kinase [Bacteroidota bacterium]